MSVILGYILCSSEIQGAFQVSLRGWLTKQSIPEMDDG